MFHIDLYARVPIYQQIIDGIKRDISLGVLRAGEQIPSIRQLSVTLQTNPNTIAKSYTELERTGILISVVGKGYYVTADAQERIRESTKREQESILSEVARTLANAGVTEEELVEQIRSVYQALQQKEEHL